MASETKFVMAKLRKHQCSGSVSRIYIMDGELD